MKVFVLSFCFLAMGSSAMASSGQWFRELIQTSSDFAATQEKDLFLADEVQIMDSYNDGTTVFVTVGPEKNGRPARAYHCWITQYAPEVGDDTVISRTRLNNKVCRPL